MRRLFEPDAGHADAFGLDGHDAAGAVVPRCRRYDGNARRKRRDLAVLTDGGGGRLLDVQRWIASVPSGFSVAVSCSASSPA